MYIISLLMFQNPGDDDKRKASNPQEKTTQLILSYFRLVTSLAGLNYRRHNGGGMPLRLHLGI